MTHNNQTEQALSLENSYQMLRLVQIEKWRQAVSVFDFYFTAKKEKERKRTRHAIPLNYYSGNQINYYSVNIKRI